MLLQKQVIDHDQFRWRRLIPHRSPNGLTSPLALSIELLLSFDLPFQNSPERSSLRKKADTTYTFLMHVHGVRMPLSRLAQLSANTRLAHRTLIVRKLKGLEEIIPYTSVHWEMLEKGVSISLSMANNFVWETVLISRAKAGDLRTREKSFQGRMSRQTLSTKASRIYETFISTSVLIIPEGSRFQRFTTSSKARLSAMRCVALARGTNQVTQADLWSR